MTIRLLMGVIAGLLGITTPSLANDFNLETSARYRLQHVGDELRGDATASTLKLRLSGHWQGSEYVETFLQADHVHAFNEDGYNSVAVTRATSPIPETVGTELNQAWIKYNSDYDWSATLGRQIINLENERHISSVEFWQNDQTFDAVTWTYNDSTEWNVSYSYIDKVHRIFGDDAKQRLPVDDIRFDSGIIRPFLELGDHQHDTHLLNLNYAFNRYLGITAYAYLIDNQTAGQLSSDTFGIRFDGAVKPKDIKYGYTAEFAHQSTDDKSPWDYKGYYVFAELSAQYKSHLLAVSHERLSEDNGFGFATSLGNNHKFLGWADVFSSYVNTDGLRDTALTYRGRKARLRWRVMAHHFASDGTGSTAGHELDIEIAYRFNRQWEVTFLGALYFTKGGVEGLAASQQDLSTFTFSLAYNL